MEILLYIFATLHLVWAIEMFIISTVFFYAKKSGNGVFASLGVFTLATGVHMIGGFLASVNSAHLIAWLVIWNAVLLVGIASTACVSYRIVKQNGEEDANPE